MAGKIRIIGGRWRGRRLAVPDRPGLRPTGDRARETLFNWLMPQLSGAACLDLFAGTGALGLEAASRGARAVTLVERDRELAASLRDLARALPDGEGLEVIQADALEWIGTASGPFDLVFVDPPFDENLHARSLEALARPGLLSDAARVYVESPAHAPPPVGSEVDGAAHDGAGGWRVEREKQVGDVRMQILSRVRQPASL